MENIQHAFQHTLMITSFVFIMMLVIEYLNVQTRGNWQKVFLKRQWSQYLLGALLGALPGCLGSFAMVTLYTHRIVTLGALVTTMIATSGDEAFVMLAMFPKNALVLFGLLTLIGIFAGLIIDLLFRSSKAPSQELHLLPLHEEYCNCFPRYQIWTQLRFCTLERAVLILFMISACLLVLTGSISPIEWNWIRITLLLVIGIGLFIVSTVPDHFLREHLWEHIVKKHLPQIFAWTFGALLILELVINRFNLETWIYQSQLLLLLMACLIGLIPESGPHLIFVTMYAQGLIPFSILLASSIVQDGHGMLPLLAHSRRAFIRVKLINFIIGLAIGAVGLLLKK